MSKWYASVVILICFWLTIEFCCCIIVYNEIARGKIPSQVPHEIITIHQSEEKCFSLCRYHKDCLSFVIEKRDGENIRCFLYNTTTHFLFLVESSVNLIFYSISYPIFHDCVDWYNAGARETGVYQITLPRGPKQVCCNMDVDGGGWLVFQRRIDNTTDFHLNWVDYKKGFGDMTSNFWLGNDILHYLTNRGETQIYIHAGRFNSETKYSKYAYVRIEDDEAYYRLDVHTLLEGVDTIAWNNGNKFSTKDNDNDNKANENCAMSYQRGGLWYGSCSAVFPNGQYQLQEESLAYVGIQWKNNWLNNLQSLKWIEFMIRTQ